MALPKKLIRWQLRVDADLQNDVVKYATMKGWDLSFTVRELLKDQLKFLNNKGSYFPKNKTEYAQPKIDEEKLYQKSLSDNPTVAELKTITPSTSSLNVYADFNKRRMECVAEDEWRSLKIEIENSEHLSQKQKYNLTKKSVQS